MNCQKCKSQRILELTAKCNDCCGYSIGNISEDGYVPEDLGIGGGDYLEFDLCLDCGQMQGQYPRPISMLENDVSDEDIALFFENYFSEGQLIFILPNRNNSVKDRAYDLCSRFGSWFKNFMEENERVSKAPSVNKFIEMYRNNKYYLGE